MSSENVNNYLPVYMKAAQELRENHGQWRVYESHGNCVVLAGPGSGKTKTLTIKLARMLAEDVKSPCGIACITYSQECARELKRRLDRLGVNERSNVFIGTVHSFCLVNILKPYGRMAGLKLPDPLKVACSNEQREIFATSVKYVYGNSRGAYRTKMDWYRRTYLDRESPEWRIDEEPIFTLIEVYEQKLRAKGLLDFDDMILWSLQLVENNKWVRKILKARFPILIVDEYQDLGLSLHRIVLNLCFKANIRLLAVGDPDQSIYGFTGAKPELLRELSKMPTVESVTLQMNYRCGKTIVQASEIVLEPEDGKHETPEDAALGTVDFYEFPEGIQEQALKICTEIIPLALSRGENRTLGDIAVLYLDCNDGDVIASAAESVGFESIRIDRNSPYRKTPLTRWLEDCAAWCSGGWRQGEPRISGLIRTWMIFNNVKGDVDNKALTLKRNLVRFLWSYRDKDITLHTWLSEFKAICLRSTFHKDCEMQDEYEVLNELLVACSPNNVIDYFRVKTFAGQGGSPTHLNLITLYSAKGREFQVVIMMGMDQGRIPSWADKSEAQKAEKRRVFYVGVTRAKHEIHMTYSGWNSNQYGRIFKQGPSEFLIQLHDKLAENC
jgi:DNA helicase II / ATP-dependent DNA helicase PcrA